MLRTLGRVCQRQTTGEQLAILCEDSINQIVDNEHQTRTLPLIWHQPLMAVSPTKYAGAILSMVGFNVIDTHPKGNGYPEVSVEDFIRHDIELILLTSEPHEFTTEEGIEIAQSIAVAGGRIPRVELIDGEDLTWFGSRTASAIARLIEFQLLLNSAN